MERSLRLASALGLAFGLALVVSGGAFGCAKESNARCANSPTVKCWTHEVCTYDPQQKCDVCRCDAPHGYAPIDKENPANGHTIQPPPQ